MTPWWPGSWRPVTDDDTMVLAQWREIRWSLWLGLTFLALVLIGLVQGGFWLKAFATSADQLPIEEVALIGERRFTADQEVRDALHTLERWSLFTADVGQIRDVLAALPWVDRVTVRREWPNRLRVFLVEQQPVAHWDGEQWLNDRAEPFMAPPRDGLASLPLLSGPDGSAAKVWNMWQQLSELLALNGHAGHALSLSGRHAWQLVLENGIALELGRKDTLARVQRFIDVWPELQRDGRVPERVDLRYDTGLAVRWQLNEQEKQKG
ncbi:cell division protein FtsQ/DivIB [Ferrimonas balearica]|uniref:cell division protein FtsQ/DivIB n=2 Tax=Ferrimonas balearica TaxID=44012 RepID=UPI0021BDC257|nr:cell division protein FtsQ/DivIB [Ferrimonas balearica]